MRILAKSDIGKARDMNQDYYYVSPIESDIKLYILADGMGGYKGGEIASNLAVNCAKNYICNQCRLWGLKQSPGICAARSGPFVLPRP